MHTTDETFMVTDHHVIVRDMEGSFHAYECGTWKHIGSSYRKSHLKKHLVPMIVERELA